MSIKKLGGDRREASVQTCATNVLVKCQFTRNKTIQQTSSNTYYSLCSTSSCAEMYQTTAESPPATRKAYIVFLFQCLGLHHQPPEGDHTYLG